MTLSEAIEIVDPDSGARANDAEPQDAIDHFLKACRIVCAAARHKENHIAGAGKMVPSSNKAPTCDGCDYQIDFPSSVHCFNCVRMYSDHYARRPESAP